MGSFEQAWQELISSGAEFEMENVEVRGIPTRVFRSAPLHLAAIWEACPAEDDDLYLVFEDEHWTYGEVRREVRTVAAHWWNDCGVRPGDRVAVAMRNYPEWVVAHWAAVSVGATVVGLNAWWTGPELEFALLDSAPKVTVVDAERFDRLQPYLHAVLGRVPMKLMAARFSISDNSFLTSWPSTRAGDPPDLDQLSIGPDHVACIFYTSGTTGAPKGAQITHRGAVHNVLNLSFMQMVTRRARQLARDGAPQSSEAEGHRPPVVMAPTPLFHVTACNCMLHPATRTGGTIVLMHKWDAGRALELIERERVTSFSGVPTMNRELLRHPDRPHRDISSLRGLTGGGAAVQPDLVDKISRLAPSAAPSTGFGLTEASGIVTVNAAARYANKPASCGRVVPTVDVKLVSQDGETLAPDPSAVGELCIRGPVVIKGYLNRPDETAEAIRDGWFHTGDIARIDEDGDVFIVDRAKDMVIRGGENVYCSEVEAAVHEHDDVAETAVFALPDERLGEIVAATVVRRSASCDLTSSGLQAFLAERLASFKIPSRIWIVDDPLPRNASGKIVKRALQDSLGVPGKPTSEPS